MQNAITLSINGYRHFIEEFRRNCTRGAGEFDVSSRFNGKTRGFRFRRKDEYLVAIDNLGTGRFKPLQEKPVDQGHYQNMMPVKALTRSSVETAFSQNFDGVYDGWSASLRVVVFMTAEAARSEVIYRAAQDVLHGKTIEYDDFEHYLKTYDKNRAMNGLSSDAFKPLDTFDYRDGSFLNDKLKLANLKA